MSDTEHGAKGRDANLTAGAAALLIQFAGEESVWVSFAHIHSISLRHQRPPLATFQVQTASAVYCGFAPPEEIRAVVKVWDGGGF